MSLIDRLYQAIVGDPRPVRPTAAEFGDDPVSAAFVEAIRERKAWRARAIAFERELRTRGMSTVALNGLVTLYERGVRAEAELRARGA